MVEGCIELLEYDPIRLIPLRYHVSSVSDNIVEITSYTFALFLETTQVISFWKPPLLYNITEIPTHTISL